MSTLRTATRLLVAAAVLGAAARAYAQPIELKDQNGTSYFINTAVDPLVRNSEASGAIANATYNKAVTVTSYFVGLTPFGFFLTTYSVQRQVDVPLRNAFAGFNGLVISGLDGMALPAPLVFNPGEGLASEDCSQNGKNRELIFQTQSFGSANLVVTRKVYVPDNAAFVRWLNVVTNTGTTPRQVGITLQGLLGSGTQTKIGTTSSGDATVAQGDLWFTSGQQVPQGQQSTEPTVGFVVQGSGAPAPAVAEGVNTGSGQAIVTYNPTIPAGGSVIIMTLTTVQGNFKEAKSTVENLIDLPSSTLHCMSEEELAQVVNFAPIAQPTTKSATITLKFNKTGQDTIQWKGKITVGQGISLAGLPVTADVGGATASFLLNKSGQANDGGGNKFNLAASLKNGVTKQGTYNVTLNLKGDFQALMAPYGLTNATVKNVPVSVPLTITAGPGTYSTGLGLTYTATQGKKGTAKSSS
jgi:hypothetical protein